MEFKSSIGSSAKIITAFISILFAGIIVTMFAKKLDGAVPVSMILPAILILTLGLSYYYSIKSYRITKDELVIQRPFDTVIYKRINIKTVERIDRKALRFVIRTFGIGGLFAYTGQFWNSRFGNMTWYLTRTDSAVMFTTSSNRKIVISPDEPEKFIAALESN